MRFTKMHGLGNDYVYVNCFEETVIDPPGLAKKISRRHFSIGSDGLILICPSKKAHGRMEMYNSDGSRAEMCGNGIRCVGKYLYDHGIAPYEEIDLETDIGILHLQLQIKAGKVNTVTVNMGKPELDPQKIPMKISENHSCDIIKFEDNIWKIHPVSMGNPHCIIFVEDLENLPIEKWGPVIENHPFFPKRTNVEFTKILSPTEIQVRVWERGSGETLACGTGACGTAVVSHLAGHTKRKVILHLLGGDLEIDWKEDNHVYMTGPAIEVFSGHINV